MEISERLDNLRAESGLSVAELARRAGYPAEQVHGWLTARRFPTTWPLVRLCRALGVTVDECLVGVEEWNYSRGKGLKQIAEGAER